MDLCSNSLKGLIFNETRFSWELVIISNKNEKVVTFEDECGFADATWTVEDEWLMDTVAMSVVVENGFDDWSWYDLPCFVHHFSVA